MACAHLRECSKTVECLPNQALAAVSAGLLEPDHTREVSGSSLGGDGPVSARKDSTFALEPMEEVGR